MFLRAGLVTFGHAMFYAVGAYTAGFGSKWFGMREAFVLVPLGILLAPWWPPWWGYSSAKYRGVFFAMLNLAVSMILYAIFCSSSTGSPAARTESQYAPQRFSALFQRATFPS